MPTLSTVIEAALDLVLPLSCAGCGRDGGVLCDSCRTGLPRLTAPYCARCADPGHPLCAACEARPPAYGAITAPFLMEGVVRDLVYSLKYRNLRASAPELGRLMTRHLESNPLPHDVIVPVPLHRSRERRRGYNQSELLAKQVSSGTGLSLDSGSLKRTRDTPPQIDMQSNDERIENVEAAFEASSELDGRRVLLVDDVVTTGSTMSACATALRAAGASSVWGLALARQA